MSLNEKILQKAKAYEKSAISMRHYLHENPELSGKEINTAAYLKEKIAPLGLLIEDVPDSTGFTALLDTGKPGKTLGIRTDIDALPVQETEDNLAGPRKVRSNVDGVMHACGHDAHMSILMHVLQILTELKDELTGKIYFIFEEGEEISSGIFQMVEHLQGRGIDAIYGNHVASFMPTGQISIEAGPRMAGSISLNFDVNGVAGHGSRPDLSVNPLIPVAHIITNLTSAWVNQLDVTETVTFGPTMIHGGEAPNVFAEKVNIQGSIRYFKVSEGEKALAFIKNIAEHTAAAHNASVTFHPNHKIGLPPLINDAELATIAQNGLEEILPGSLVRGVQWFASETFSLYGEVAPYCFSFVGMKSEAYGSGAEHHNNYFDTDDDAIYYGIVSATKFAVDYLIK